MGPKFSISEVCSTSWQRTKTQIWVLAGLLIGMTIYAERFCHAYAKIHSGYNRY